MAFWVTFVWWIVSLIVGELLRPKPKIENARPASLGDFQFPTAEEGRIVPVIWGTVRVNGPNVLWYGDLEAVPIKEKIKTGLWSSSTIIKGYKYYLGIQLGLCRGPLKAGTITTVGIRRIWVDDEILRPDTAGWVYDGTITIDAEEFFGEDTGGVGGTIRVHDGNLTQSLNTYMLAQTGEIDPTLLPAYRGTAYLMFEHFYVGNASSLRPWNFEVRRIPDGLGLGANATVNDGDANPMNVLFEVMTSSEWGVGVTNINLSQWASIAAILKAEGNGYSRILDSTVEAADIIGDIERQVDGVLEYDALNSVYLFRLIRETDYPSPVSLVPAFTEDNILELEFGRESWQETTNQVRVGYVDKNKDFKGTFAIAQDMANQLIQQGDNVVVSEAFPGCSSAALANDLAWRQLRTYSYPLAKGKIKSTRAIYDLQPGDLASITWPPLDLVDFYVRINRVQLGDLQSNELIYDWTQDVFQTAVSVFADPEGSNWNLGSGAPLAPIAFRLFNVPTQYSDTNLYQQLGIVAARANKRQRYYDVYYVENTGSTPTDVQFEDNYNIRVNDYTPTALLAEALPLTQNFSPEDFDDDTFLVNTGIDMDRVNLTATTTQLNGQAPPNLALVDDEIIFFTSVTTLASPTDHYRLNGVRRGMLDTKPADHSAGARIWFFTYGIGVIDAETTEGNTGWVRLQPVGADSSLPLTSSPTGEIQGSVVITNRYEGNAPPANPEINGTRFDDFQGALTGGTLQITWKGRDTGLDTTRSDTQESANREHRSGTTYSLRVYWSGDAYPGTLVYSLDNIPFASSFASPNGGKMNISGFVREPGSPLSSPRASQDYHVEFWSNRLGYASQVWEADIEVTGYGLSYGGEFTAGGIGDALLPSPYPFSPTPSPTPTAAFSPEAGIPVRGGYGGIDFEGSFLRPGEVLAADELFPGAGFAASKTWKFQALATAPTTLYLEMFYTYFDPVNAVTLQGRVINAVVVTNTMTLENIAQALGTAILNQLPEGVTYTTDGAGTLTVTSPGEFNAVLWNYGHFIQNYDQNVPLAFHDGYLGNLEKVDPVTQVAFIDYYTLDSDGNEELAPDSDTTQWGTVESNNRSPYRNFRFTIEALHDHERSFMGGTTHEGAVRFSEYNLSSTSIPLRRKALENLAASLNKSSFSTFGWVTTSSAFLPDATGTWQGGTLVGMDGEPIVRECLVLMMRPNYRIVPTTMTEDKSNIFGYAGYRPLVKEARHPVASYTGNTAPVGALAEVTIQWNCQHDAPNSTLPWLLRISSTGSASVASYFATPSASDVTRRCLHDMWADLRQQVISGSPYEARLIIGADGFNTGLRIHYANQAPEVELVTPYSISPQQFNYTVKMVGKSGLTL